MRFLIIFLLGFGVQSNEPSITEIRNNEKIELLGSLLSGDRYLTNDFVLRIHKKENPYGSAGNDSGEITHSYLFTISDNDDAPRRSVFEIGEFYGPNVKAVREKEKLIEVDIEYYANRRKTVKTVFVRHHQVSF